jgi:WD40 repeat protein
LCLTLVMVCLANAQTLNLARATSAQMEHPSWVMQLRFTPDGREIVAIDLEGNLRVWEAKTGRLLREWKAGDGRSLLCLDVSPDGKFISVGDSSGRLYLLSFEKLQVEREFRADYKIVNAVVFSGAGDHLVSGGGEGVVRIWRLDGKNELEEIKPNNGDIVSLAFTPDRKFLVVGALNRDFRSEGGELGIWNWQSKERVRRFVGSPGLRALAISPNGRLVASAVFKPAVRLFITPTGEGDRFEATVKTLGENDEPVEVWVWELETGETVEMIRAELGAAAIAFSPEGDVLACAGDHGLMLHDLVENSVYERGRHDTRTRVDAIAFNPTSNQIVIAQQRDRIAEAKDEGLKKIADPFFMSIAGMAKDGDAPSTKIPSECGRLTGKSFLDTLSVTPQKSDEDAKLWSIYRTTLAKGEKEKARDALAKLAADFPRFSEVRRVMAVLFEAVALSKAQAPLDEAIKNDPNCAACYRTLGDLQIKAGQAAKAIPNYRRALEINPNYGLVEGLLAVALRTRAIEIINPDDSKAMKEAASMIVEAISLRPTDATHYTNLGTLLFLTGDFDGDIEALCVAQELRPDHARIYYNLGSAYQQKGDKEKAVAAYRRYVAMGEKGEEARVERARKRIEELTRPK